MNESRSTSVDIDDQEAIRQAQTPTLLAHQDRPSAAHLPAPRTRHPKSRPEHNRGSMAGVGAQTVRTDVTERTTVKPRTVDPSLATDSAESRIESAPPITGPNVVRRIGGLPTKLLGIARSLPRPNRTNRRPYCPSRREAFIENAAMDREMFRL